jgi:hypothetical protein
MSGGDVNIVCGNNGEALPYENALKILAHKN